METKEKKVVKIFKKVFGVGASIGATAIIGCALKKVDTSTVKGLSKLALPLGVIGLSYCAGEYAQKGAEQKIDDACDAYDGIKDLFEKLDEVEEDLEEFEPKVETAV